MIKCSLGPLPSVTQWLSNVSQRSCPITSYSKVSSTLVYRMIFKKMLIHKGRKNPTVAFTQQIFAERTLHANDYSRSWGYNQQYKVLACWQWVFLLGVRNNKQMNVIWEVVKESTMLWLVFAWYIFSHPYIFNPSISLY